MTKYRTNKTRDQMIRIAMISGEHKIFMETKTVCPWCNTYSLLLKEKNAHYWCMECNAEGSLNQLERELLCRLQREKRGVLQ